MLITWQIINVIYRSWASSSRCCQLSKKKYVRPLWTRHLWGQTSYLTLAPSAARALCPQQPSIYLSLTEAVRSRGWELWLTQRRPTGEVTGSPQKCSVCCMQISVVVTEDFCARLSSCDVLNMWPRLPDTGACEAVWSHFVLLIFNLWGKVSSYLGSSLPVSFSVCIDGAFSPDTEVHLPKSVECVLDWSWVVLERGAPEGAVPDKASHHQVGEMKVIAD